MMQYLDNSQRQVEMFTRKQVSMYYNCTHFELEISYSSVRDFKFGPDIRSIRQCWFDLNLDRANEQQFYCYV